ncbi:NADPH-dependent ferric siderophore reductase [Actinocorallia herbida]|uniref:NADPH-dependent ferric siderophore reductase n=1 Tax=Actinocorallia herbida TaxID=58109 RepID=A0A3N1CR08_9ACTN|nr:siderophore-interacting protein [Actinocorallia herbida]ROO83148.1 NADPH-dependent ferric siderophore reductase [Actinocorallia herbida]
MAERRVPNPYRTVVLRTEQLTPHMVRVVVGGDDLKQRFHAGDFTDHYVKLQFPRPGSPTPFDPAAIRRELPRDKWPITRTYTVREWDPAAAELTLDFVVHGDSGIAGPWAASARPGDELWLAGPGGGYRPSADAGWHLLAGDESAVPAIAASLEQLPEGATAIALLEVESAEEEVPLPSLPGLTVTWLHRGSAPVGELLTAAFTALEFPSQDVQAFVHGEAGLVKAIRRDLRVTREIPLAQLSISGYWRLGADEDGWQSSKSTWNAQVEAEESSALS